MVKTVSIDLLRTLQKPLDPKIHSVPALLILKNKEYLFGKAVFDYLLLPNRGVLFSGQTTRDVKTSKDASENSQQLFNSNDVVGEPRAFTLGAISAEQFSTIDDDNAIIDDKNYNWDIISNNDVITNNIKKEESSVVTNPVLQDTGGKTKLPSMEEIMKQRASDII